ncbi:MAG TPA: GHKL domain-containing protein [Crocinitomicaceae bacterium]|nr:GHKL domain-containing protein [Crocinitomicaceae bacterium]
MKEQIYPTNVSAMRMIQAIILIACFAILDFVILTHFSFSKSFSIADALSFFGFTTLFAGLLFTIQRNHHSKLVLNSQNIGTVLFFVLLTSFFNYLVVGNFVSSLDSYEVHFWIILLLKTFIIFLLLFIFLFIFWIDQQKVQELRFQNFVIEKEREAGKIQLNSLQQQFKPHFLFNSLNSINALTLQNSEEARRMIHLLSDFMRGAVKEDQSELVSLSQEINHIQLYTDIEKVRFGERLTVNFSIPKKCESLQVPSLILQPIIENAIKYGLYGHTENVNIDILAEHQKNYLIISISNPHDATTQLSSKGTGYGLSSIRKKMLILFNQYNLLLTNEKNGIFTTTLKIPQNEI